MATENEVIIASLVDQLAPGHWQYEAPLTGSDGRTVYWEHAGMLDLPDHARKWEFEKT